MASVDITVHTGDDSYNVELEIPETMEQAYGTDKSHLDGLMDRAVAKMKRSYREGQ